MRSFDAVKLVLDKAPKDLTIVQRVVFVQIAHKQPNCFATVKELGRECGISQEKTVSKAVKVLESRGLILVIRRAYSSNRYLVHPSFVEGREIPVLDLHDTPVVSLHDTPVVSLHDTPVKQTYNKQLNKQQFEEFWESYPRKEGRKKAEGIFAKLAPNDVSLVLAASRTYRESVGSRELRFVKLASTWLEQECWLDQVEVESDDWMSRALDD